MTKHAVADMPHSMYVQINDRVVPVRAWSQGHLDMGLDDAPYLRAIVDVFEDGKLVFNALIDRVDEATGAVRYVFKDTR